MTELHNSSTTASVVTDRSCRSADRNETASSNWLLALAVLKDRTAAWRA